MKTIFKMAAALLCVTGLASCNKDDTNGEEYLEVSYANLNGTWRLAEWSGLAVGEGTYCYISFDRREHTFTMYQNFDSMGARRISGSFSIDTDDYLGEVVSGKYDYGNGAWNHDYVVSELLSDSMTWTAVDDETDVCKYVRVDEVPEEIVSSAREEFETKSSASSVFLPL